MDLGFEVMRKSLYADGINFTNWALFIESVNRTRHIMMDRSAKMADRGLERVAPSSANVARLIAEKEEAFQLAQQGLTLVEGARGTLSPRHVEGLRASFIAGARADANLSPPTGGPDAVLPVGGDIERGRPRAPAPARARCRRHGPAPRSKRPKGICRR